MYRLYFCYQKYQKYLGEPKLAISQVLQCSVFIPLKPTRYAIHAYLPLKNLFLLHKEKNQKVIPGFFMMIFIETISQISQHQQR